MEKILTIENGSLSVHNLAHSHGKKSTPHCTNMPTWTRLVVAFKSDAPTPDVDEIFACLRRCYLVGYCGLYESTGQVSLYIQTISKKWRMTPSKVIRILASFGAEGTPRTFKYRNGAVFAEKGEFREAGERRKKTVAPPETARSSSPTTINNISNIHNDHSVNFNDNRVINIHINALGSEDVSHIKMEQFKNLFEGSTEEILSRMQEMLPPKTYQQCIESAWNGLQNKLYKRKCSGEGPPDQAETDTDSDAAADDELDYEDVTLYGAPIKYDSNPESDYNRKAKAKVGRISMCNLRASGAAVELPTQFAELLTQNMSNCNVLHPKNAGYFEYFNGTTWVKKATVEAETFVSVWAGKVKECFDLLGERHGDAWLNSYEAMYASIVIGKLKCQDFHQDCKKYMEAQIKRAALVAVDNANSRIKAVESSTGKRVRRVNSKGDDEERKRKVHRNVLWNELIDKFS